MPIPDELLHRAPRRVRQLGRMFKIAVLIGAGAMFLHLAYPSTPPMFRNFGIVHTSIGTAVVACGGEVTESCGDATALVFDSCDGMNEHFPDATSTDPKTTDNAVRRFIGKRPPAGSRWEVYCGANGMAHDHLADLKST